MTQNNGTGPWEAASTALATSLTALDQARRLLVDLAVDTANDGDAIQEAIDAIDASGRVLAPVARSVDLDAVAEREQP